MVGRDWPDEIPAEYREQYGLRKLRDVNKPQLDSKVKERARSFAAESVAEVKRRIFPRHGL